MSELEGIKDFIEANKESLENMNKEMIARCGRVPLVCLTVEEAKSLLNMTKVFCICAQASNHNRLEQLIDLEKALTNRIEQAEGKRCLTQKTI